MMEYYIADNFCCPECKQKSLHVIGNHTPSLDIICTACHRKFEVKSKCLSVKTLPPDITLKHGLYHNYINQSSNGLNVIIIIYGADRINKNIIIREILYANNKELYNSKNITVTKNYDSNLSTINIKNKYYLTKLNLESTNISIQIS